MNFLVHLSLGLGAFLAVVNFFSAMVHFAAHSDRITQALISSPALPGPPAFTEGPKVAHTNANSSPQILAPNAAGEPNSQEPVPGTHRKPKRPVPG